MFHKQIERLTLQSSTGYLLCWDLVNQITINKVDVYHCIMIWYIWLIIEKLLKYYNKDVSINLSVN